MRCGSSPSGALIHTLVQRVPVRRSRGRGSAPLEVTVDRGPADTELRGDLPNGVRPVPVRSPLLIHAPGEFHLPGAELGFLPTGAPTGAGSSQTIPGAFGHQGVLEF